MGHQKEERDKLQGDQTWLRRVTEQLKGLSLSDRQLRMKHRGRYIFTDKKHPWRGIFSVITGLFALSSIVLSVVLTYTQSSEGAASYAVGLLFASLFSLAGLIMGILASTEKDVYTFFPRIGIILNLISVLLLAGIVWLGVR